MTDETVEHSLAGGVDQAGAVVRVGKTVRRPGGVNAEAVRLFLKYLERSGFRAAPRFLGMDRQGREILEYVAGDVAVPPFPDWAADEELLVSVAQMQRALHAAAVGFALPEGVVWRERRLPPGAEGDLVCHTDLCLENVVVREGRAAAFIDFDLAVPADRLFDIAVAVRHWVPLRAPSDITDARAESDLFRRFHLFAAVHGLSSDERGRVLDILLGFLDIALENIRASAEAGHPGYAGMWADGYEEMNRRSRDWIVAHRHQLAGGQGLG
ncbi:phosphotransferase [Streptomyces sp. NY05-11A]|uniref:phosphotransferase n=1 Tax=Streptomyces soliscabiei TaxID=588897 RepID=UPI0029A60565|nr:phosphotransferase [Streptomyces sp. NY05-11A]MDX2678707.1 phosphotransferase [Streptomyces sp. NY05-11A]